MKTPAFLQIVMVGTLLFACSSSAMAQGAGLSQGQAVKNTTPNPTTTRKTCSHCGITMGNITYAWQHESWCPYYRSSGGSSSSRSSSRSYGTYTAASAASYALGSLLSGLISSSWGRKASQRTVDPQAEAKEQKRKENYNKIEDRKRPLREESRKYWKYGDYEILANGHALSSECKGERCDGYTLSIVNTKTGKEVVPKFTKAIHKQYKSSKVPLGTCCLDDDHWWCINYFFDSKQQESSPLLDGMLFVYDMEIYDRKYRNKTLSSGYSGLCKIVNDNLQWVLKVKEPHPTLGEDFIYIPNSTCFLKEGEKHNTIYAPLKGATLDSLVWTRYDKDFIYVRQPKDTLYFNVYDLELNTAFPEYPYIEPKPLSDIGFYFLVGNDKGYGAIDRKGNILIPLMYKSGRAVNKAWSDYKSISYTLWYKHEAAKYIDKKGEFEKTEHFEARMKDAKMQEEYLRDIMADAPQRYLEEKVWEKGDLQLMLGEYDADEECFPIIVAMAPWNSIELTVPFADAKTFKKEFNSIKAAAAKTAQLGIRNDVPSIEAITFTTSDGKAYKFGE